GDHDDADTWLRIIVAIEMMRQEPSGPPSGPRSRLISRLAVQPGRPEWRVLCTLAAVRGTTIAPLRSTQCCRCAELVHRRCRRSPSVYPLPSRTGDPILRLRRGRVQHDGDPAADRQRQTDDLRTAKRLV